MKDEDQANSITLVGAVSMGTGVTIDAGIFALTGQVAELAGNLFPLAVTYGAGENALANRELFAAQMTTAQRLEAEQMTRA
jgi:amino acid transporter